MTIKVTVTNEDKTRQVKAIRLVDHGIRETYVIEPEETQSFHIWHDNSIVLEEKE